MIDQLQLNSTFPKYSRCHLSKKQNKTSKKFLNAAEFDIWHSRKTSADFAKSRRPLTFITHHSLSWVIRISSFRKRKKLKILSTMNLHKKASFVAFEEIGALIKSFCKTIKVTTWLQSYNKSMHVKSIKKKKSPKVRQEMIERHQTSPIRGRQREHKFPCHRIVIRRVTTDNIMVF